MARVGASPCRGSPGNAGKYYIIIAAEALILWKKLKKVLDIRGCVYYYIRARESREVRVNAMKQEIALETEVTSAEYVRSSGG